MCQRTQCAAVGKRIFGIGSATAGDGERRAAPITRCRVERIQIDITRQRQSSQHGCGGVFGVTVGRDASQRWCIVDRVDGDGDGLGIKQIIFAGSGSGANRDDLIQGRRVAKLPQIIGADRQSIAADKVGVSGVA